MKIFLYMYFIETFLCFQISFYSKARNSLYNIVSFLGKTQ